MDIPIFDDYCFACGSRNPIGLKMQVAYLQESRTAESTLALPKEYQGWLEVIHGGIVATLLDEIMAHAVWHFVGPGVTLSLEVQYRQPLAPGEIILARGNLTEIKGRRLTAQGEIIRQIDNSRIANGKSRFLLLEGRKSMTKEG
ncbi:PaaI family thioesterase [Desulfobacca acetoxidans]|uniref:Thioesterase superfamily protein n=1 Tax=Desulfobacca acetoxidans (strain ATCC 700848 / DSM 11109 / ASRB2) TaxID=880072 RepID=F2ND98_DESAR|nr:PaaI family thioesterase [Desulfobacca acetoxidans]AEB09964.1 thioesterase superfamily protein [Desulfobacca acetoxidans DSM 11109]HAY20848.1 PaaI family thioesterase [Desulfobacterales bacterium]